VLLYHLIVENRRPVRPACIPAAWQDHPGFVIGEWQIVFSPQQTSTSLLMQNVARSIDFVIGE
jgi:hypothetical protein